MKKKLQYFYMAVLTFCSAFVWIESFKMLFIYIPGGNYPVFRTTKLPAGNTQISFILRTENIMHCLVFILTSAIILAFSYAMAQVLMKKPFDLQRILWFQFVNFMLVLILMFYIITSLGANFG